jgi:hypothetical protein
MKSIAIAVELGCGCALCQLLAKQMLLGHGISDPETIKAFNALRESNGYRGKPVYGQSWVDLLVDHEAYADKRGATLPKEWLAVNLSDEFIHSLMPVEKTRPAPRPKLSEEELAILEFEKVYAPVIHQRNGRVRR